MGVSGYAPDPPVFQTGASTKLASPPDKKKLRIFWRSGVFDILGSCCPLPYHNFPRMFFHWRIIPFSNHTWTKLPIIAFRLNHHIDMSEEVLHFDVILFVIYLSC